MQATDVNPNVSGFLNREKFPEIIALSATDKAELRRILLYLKNQLSDEPVSKSYRVIAAETRRSFSVKDPCRILLVVETDEKAINVCQKAIEWIGSRPESTWSEKSIFYGENNDYGGLAFVFPGQGSQYISMGKEIMECFPEARVTLRHADEIFDRTESLSTCIYPAISNNKEEKAAAEARLRSTDIAQPAIGAVSLAMLKVLHRFNITPDAACGHSYGELPALFSAGRMTDASLMSLSIARGKYMAEAGRGKDSGSMLAVMAPLAIIEDLLKSSGSEVILANENSQDQGVLSGSTEAILQMKSLLAEHKIRSTLLPVAAAFHSNLVKDAAVPFQQALEKTDFMESTVPVYSNTTGTRYPVSVPETKNLLGRHLINPVHFVNEIKNMYKDGIRVFVEIGPKAVLTGLIRSILKEQHFIAIAVDSSSGRRSGLADFAKTLCQIASIGYPVNLNKWLDRSDS